MRRVRGDVGPIRRVLGPARQGGRGGIGALGLIMALGPRLRGDDVVGGCAGMTLRDSEGCCACTGREIGMAGVRLD